MTLYVRLTEQHTGDLNYRCFFLWVVHYLREHSTVARLTEIRFYPKSDKSYIRQSHYITYV